MASLHEHKLVWEKERENQTLKDRVKELEKQLSDLQYQCDALKDGIYHRSIEKDLLT